MDGPFGNAVDAMKRFEHKEMHVEVLAWMSDIDGKNWDDRASMSENLMLMMLMKSWKMYDGSTSWILCEDFGFTNE